MPQWSVLIVCPVQTLAIPAPAIQLSASLRRFWEFALKPDQVFLRKLMGADFRFKPNDVFKRRGKTLTQAKPKYFTNGMV